MKARFQTRRDAGIVLASQLVGYAGTHATVLGLPPAGLPIAQEVATRLGCALDLLPVRNIHVPCDERSTIGAVAPEGICVLNDETVDLLDIENDAIGSLRCRADAELDEMGRCLRGGQPPPGCGGRTVILVDDAIADTSKVRAAILYLHRQDALQIVVATPIATRNAVRVLRRICNDVAVLEIVDDAEKFEEVYADRALPSDSEIRKMLGVREAEPTLS